MVCTSFAGTFVLVATMMIVRYSGQRHGCGQKAQRSSAMPIRFLIVLSFLISPVSMSAPADRFEHNFPEELPAFA
jgi:hypothetical protein